MSIRVAINGFGRIGRNILRAHFESNAHPNIQIIAINDLGDVKTNAHLLRYDTTHGKFAGSVTVEGNDMVVNGQKIHVSAERDPKNCPWKTFNVDIVLECTGFFTSKEKAAAHIAAGAKKVLISAPAEGVDATIVYGVNHQTLKATDTIVSNASCTTNCLAPLVKVLHEHCGIEQGLMNTVHAYTNDQALIDVYHTDLRRARAAAHSMIPTKTGAASAVGLVLPELNGKLDGFAIRVPTINVSVIDFTFTASRMTSVEKINQAMKQAAQHELKNILEVNEVPLVSVDFSTASYFFAAAAVTGGTVSIQPTRRKESKQGDIEFLTILEKMGCVVEESPQGLTVKGPSQLHGVSVDMRNCSDVFMTLAAIAPFANSPTSITNIAHTRLKESNRIAVMHQELKKLNIQVEEGQDWIKIYPGTPTPGKIDSHGDHRIAMSFSILGLKSPGIEIEGANCVNKTCPEFFVLLDTLYGDHCPENKAPNT